jgi:hypothetical protein
MRVLFYLYGQFYLSAKTPKEWQMVPMDPTIRCQFSWTKLPVLDLKHTLRNVSFLKVGLYMIVLMLRTLGSNVILVSFIIQLLQLSLVSNIRCVFFYRC